MLPSEALAFRPASLGRVLTGGDDYEILFTAPPAAANALASLSRAHNLPVTVIGRMIPAPAGTGDHVTVLDGSGCPLAFDRGGWTHF